MAKFKISKKFKKKRLHKSPEKISLISSYSSPVPEGEYIVENIVSRKISRGKVFYEVKWKDYDEIFNTWEPLSNLKNSMNLVSEFEDKYEQNENKIIPIKETKKGHFRKGDIAERIISCKPNKNKNQFFFEVEFKKRKDGSKPENEILSSQELRVFDPDLILSFYEQNIIFK